MSQQKIKPVFLEGNFKYLVFETGYTSRIMTELLSDEEVSDEEEQIEQENFDEVKKAFQNKVNDKKHIKNFELLYIEDGQIYFSKSDTKEVDNLVKTLSIGGNYSGYIVFKNDEKNKISFKSIINTTNFLGKLDYCGCLGMDTLTEIKQLDNILILSYDTESG